MKIVYWSSSGVTKRLSERFTHESVSNYSGGDYLLAVPSYGSPRTGGYTPPAVVRFLRDHRHGCRGVIGIGNRNFGNDFCKAAYEINRDYGIPIVATIDMVASEQEIQTITRALGGHGLSQDYHELNAMLNLFGENGEIQTDKDKEAARQYFLQHVNPNTVFFHDLEEKIGYMTDNGYWDEEVFAQYDYLDVKDLFRQAYDHKFRFPTFVGAYKFYTSYALKTYDGDRYLERFEDRVTMTALFLAQGDVVQASQYVDLMMSGVYQPATPTFLNAGRKDAGELVSCFLLRTEDNMESIGRVINSSLQLSKRGGGVALLLSNLRESGAPIKNVAGASSGVVPVMKILEDSFSYANQLGARQGAGAVYLHAHHPDIMTFLDTKRENADEKLRIKTLSLGVVIPDITFELAKNNEDMYLFSPYDVERIYGKAFADINVTEEYYALVENPEISKTKISARKLFQTIAELQFESGYPYIMFEDTVNEANPIAGKITHSNLCVAPETRLLTDQGYVEIADVAGGTVNAWNGVRFSESYVAKTGEDQALISVRLSNGAVLDVTPYHEFYVQNEYHGKPVAVAAGELQEGDKLAKFDLPTITGGGPELPFAYTAGLFTADGTYTDTGKPKLYLYGEKMRLVEHIEYVSGSGRVDGSDRLTYQLDQAIAPKFMVPTNYSLQSKLDWLAGLIDGDGTGNGVIGIQIGSSRPEFLEDVRVMLTTLGVHSKVSFGNKGGMRRFKPDQKEYMCQNTYRLVISGAEAQKLVSLGIETHRVSLEPYQHQRNALQFVTVVSIEDHGRVDDTYCLNEPEFHKVVFEGVQTGNCSEILQVSTPSTYSANLDYHHIGDDISCNLGSLNIERAMDGPVPLSHVVGNSIRALTAVSDMSDIDSVPSIAAGNASKHAIGLGQMNLHGYLAKHGIEYGSEEALDFVNVYFSTVRFWALQESVLIAMEKGVAFDGFEESGYADGSALDSYTRADNFPLTGKVAELFDGVFIPDRYDWEDLSKSIQEHGLYNAYLLAVPPTGSISYVNGSTSSIHPITAPVEIRKEGKMGRVYYPAFGLSKETLPFYKDAYEIGPEAIIDTYAAATPHVDQGLSLTLFFKDTATTRDLNKAYVYAWRKGIKTLYYSRIRQAALEGTEVSECVSCQL